MNGLHIDTALFDLKEGVEQIEKAVMSQVDFDNLADMDPSGLDAMKGYRKSKRAAFDMIERLYNRLDKIEKQQDKILSKLEVIKYEVTNKNVNKVDTK